MLSIMKKVIAIILFLFLSFSLSATNLALGIDMMSLDSLDGPLSIRGECGVILDDDFRFSFNFGYYQKKDVDILLKGARFALSADCFLFENSGMYAGVNVVDLSYLWGFDAPSDNPFVMTQVRLGYLYTYHDRFSLDIRLTLNDPVKVSESSSRFLQDCFKQYSKYYFAIILSYGFPIPWLLKGE